MTFDLRALRFQFAARDPISFPPGGPANSLRGALGHALRKLACVPACPGSQGRPTGDCELRAACLYARIFEPAAVASGPSGLAHWPRPFVLRVSHLAGCAVTPGDSFWLGVNLFELSSPVLQHLERAFAEIGCAGFGPERRRADLMRVECAPVSIPLRQGAAECSRLRVEFRTPTELKSGQAVACEPEFGVLFARARDRVSTLRGLYGSGPLELDFRALGERAAAVKMARSELQRVESQRRSSRTGQVHSLGGFTGWAEYEGALSEFLPLLEAARWTGVGRQCVWGKGEIELRAT
ncbi:MAG TPA: CRISPR system precrRNA processing endoribonuclease RAMP protein Cas6 [Bryobacteraceae bacterium]|nr:CRISPR system precrRNA processing endoribonuclease RAMP protein Cas6 [Bryobacteraceae bacterium]